MAKSYLKIIIFCLVLFWALDTHAATIKSPPTSAGLVGYWSLNEGQGTNATDSSGNRNTGTTSGGPTWTDGKRGKAMNFDGSDDYIDLGNPSSLKITGSMTLSAWVWLNAINAGSTADDTFIAKSGGFGSRGWYLSGYDVGDGLEKIRFVISSNGTGVKNCTGLTTLAMGQWHHVTGVYNASGQTMAVYLNGLNDNCADESPPSSQNDPAVSVNIGRENGSDLINGKIDEVRIYNRALSASEVNALYKSGQTIINAPQNTYLTSGLVGMWTFNGKDLTSTTAIDVSRRGNNGTLTNGPGPVVGKVGQGLEFDGVNDYVDFGSGSSLDVSGAEITLAMWANPNKIGWWHTIDRYSCYYLDLLASGKYWFVLGTIGDITGATVVNKGDWHHVVAVKSPTQMLLYLDGVQDASLTVTGNLKDDCTSTILGKFSGGAGYEFPGKFDEVRIYNRALSAAEVNALYKSGAATIKAPDNTGLVGYWSFNEGSGSFAGDASGNRNNGVLTSGPTWVDGKRGKAVKFDGVDDYVITASSPLNPSTNTFTAAMWVKINPSSNEYNFLSQQNGSGTGRVWLGYSGSTCGASKLFAYLAGACVISTNNVSSNTWVHIVATWNPTKLTLTLYMNGVQEGLGTLIAESANGVMVIGSNKSVGTNDTDGLIDEVRIYNRALSASEVYGLYKSK